MPKSSAQGSGQESKTSRSSRTRAEVPDPAHEGEEVTPDNIEEFLPDSVELALHDPHDEHDVITVLDRHDVEQIVMEIQRRALKVWVYDLPGERGKRRRELSYKGVRDVVALMNHTGRVRIGMLPDSLKLERFREDLGNGGPEPMVRATIFARDEVTGMTMPGVSTEPLYLKLKKSTADAKRADGKEIPEDNRIFDPFAETKAANKAARNALRTFIPEEAAQAVLAAYSGESDRVLRIQTEAQAKAEELPPLDDETRERIARAEAIYDEIRELGGGRGKVDFPPGVFNAYLFTARRDGTWEPFMAYLEKRRADMEAGYAS